MDNRIHPAYEHVFKNFLKVLVPVILLLVVATTSFYTVQPGEVAVILRFGKLYGTSSEGLHFKIPFGVDQITKVEIAKIHTEEFGFVTYQPGVRTSYRPSDNKDESLVLTGDLNIVDVPWIVQYRIKNPTDYLFNVRNIVKTLRDISESVMREILGDRSVDEVLTVGRQDIEYLAKTKMQDLLNRYKMGVELNMVKLKNVRPPGPVARSFNEVNESRQERERMINEALAEYNKTIPRVKGEAQQILSQAEGYAINKVNMAKGDVAKFLALLKEYRKAKAITRTRLYLETMNEVYRNAGKKLILDEDVKSILPLLNVENLTK